MFDPLYSLIIALLLIAFLAYLFWPDKGLLDSRKKANRNRDRVLIEDTLKFLFDNEYKYDEKASQINAIAGSLNLSTDSVAELIPKLESLELIRVEENNIFLTEVGRSYALRVIRIHRIWERYLADETGIAEKDWHNEADHKEHLISFQEANLIAEKLGNPVIDPHGDPIPSPSGELPEFDGKAMNAVEAGVVAKIVHVEDKPKTIYSQLLAMGIYPGLKIRIIEKANDKIKFELNGEERILAPVFAANVRVKERSVVETSIDKYELLSNIPKGDKSKVLGISPACRTQQKRRLMDLGIVPGTEIEVILESVGRNPRAYKILNTLIALRTKHASMIFVEPPNN